jgi:putative Ca2+/H+ antiporter (TMEM165/GDT1 family)
VEFYPLVLNRSTPFLESSPEDSSIQALAEQETDSGIVIEELELPAESSSNFQPTSKPESSGGSWKVFLTTFGTVFLAELGDKTQVSTLLMSAEFHAPWMVFTGAAAALLTTTLLGVLVGRWLSTRFSPKTLDTATGILLAFISAWLLWDVLNS